MAYTLHGNTYRNTTSGNKIKADAAAYMQQVLGPALNSGDCNQIAAARTMVKTLKARYAADAVSGGYNEKRANEHYADAASTMQAAIEVKWVGMNCPQVIASQDQEEATRRTQQAYDDIDSNLGTELALKEYLIYGLGAAVVLFGTFYIILKRRKK